VINTFEFFNQYFGKHLVSQKGEPHVVAYRALSSNHMLSKGTPSRLVSGWAIIRPSISSLKFAIAAKGLNIDPRTQVEAFMAELEEWDGIEPRIFLLLDQAPVPIENLFMSVDKRAIRICSPAGVESFDLNEAPTEESGGIQKAMWKRKP